MGAAHFPDRARRVLSLIRQTRAGELNDPRFHHRFTGHGPYADVLARRFETASRRFGFDETRTQLDCGRFAVPGEAAAAAPRQMSLFG